MARLPAIRSGVGVSLEDDSVEVMLADLALATSPESYALFLREDVQRYFTDEADHRFAQEGARSGVWAPLSRLTQYQRALQGYSPEHPINKRTGDLETYVTKTEGTVATAGFETSWTWPPATDPLTTEKFAVAQGGRKGGRTPARPVIEADSTDLEAVLLLLEGHLRTVLDV